MPRIAAIIPARFASTRFPGKPLHLLAGKPLIQHVWERCRRAREISEVIVATDDMRIAEAAFAFGAEVALTSPKHRSGTDRIAEVAAKLRGVSHVINVQGDEPIVDPKLIDRLAKTLRENAKLDMVTAANPFPKAESPENSNAVKVVREPRWRRALFFAQRDSVRPGRKRSAAVLSTPGHLRILSAFLLQFVKWKPTALENAEQLEQLRALEHGARIRVLITKSASVGIDTPDDVPRFSTHG